MSLFLGKSTEVFRGKRVSWLQQFQKMYIYEKRERENKCNKMGSLGDQSVDIHCVIFSIKSVITLKQKGFGVRGSGSYSGNLTVGRSCPCSHSCNPSSPGCQYKEGKKKKELKPAFPGIAKGAKGPSLGV